MGWASDPNASPAFDEATLAADSETVPRPRRLPADGRNLRTGAVIEPYIIVSELGRGAMGAVYAAFDPRLERRVAIKLLLDPRRGGDAEARLRREAQSLARLSHPNVAAVHDVALGVAARGRPLVARRRLGVPPGADYEVLDQDHIVLIDAEDVGEDSVAIWNARADEIIYRVPAQPSE